MTDRPRRTGSTRLWLSGSGLYGGVGSATKVYLR